MQAACQGVQTNGALVLSVAAGLSIATLSRYLGGTRRIVRVMPNTPGKIGLGVSGMFADGSVSDQDKAAADSIMRAASPYGATAKSGCTILLASAAAGRLMCFICWMR